MTESRAIREAYGLRRAREKSYSGKMSSSATRAGDASLRRGFFVVMAFVTRGASGAEDADAVIPAFREHYCQEPAPNRQAEQGQPNLSTRMARIFNDSTQRVGEDRERLVETDVVFLPICGILARVPLERKCHALKLPRSPRHPPRHTEA